MGSTSSDNSQVVAQVPEMRIENIEIVEDNSLPPGYIHQVRTTSSSGSALAKSYSAYVGPYGCFQSKRKLMQRHAEELDKLSRAHIIVSPDGTCEMRNVTPVSDRTLSAPDTTPSESFQLDIFRHGLDSTDTDDQDPDIDIDQDQYYHHFVTMLNIYWDRNATYHDNISSILDYPITRSGFFIGIIYNLDTWDEYEMFHQRAMIHWELVRHTNRELHAALTLLFKDFRKYLHVAKHLCGENTFSYSSPKQSSEGFKLFKLTDPDGEYYLHNRNCPSCLHRAQCNFCETGIQTKKQAMTFSWKFNFDESRRL